MKRIKLIRLNLGLQGLSATIFKVRDKIEAMIKKLELFSVCIHKYNTQVFQSLSDFFCVQMNSSLRTTSNVNMTQAAGAKSTLGFRLHPNVDLAPAA